MLLLGKCMEFPTSFVSWNEDKLDSIRRLSSFLFSLNVTLTFTFFKLLKKRYIIVYQIHSTDYVVVCFLLDDVICSVIFLQSVSVPVGPSNELPFSLKSDTKRPLETFYFSMHSMIHTSWFMYLFGWSTSKRFMIKLRRTLFVSAVTSFIFLTCGPSFSASVEWSVAPSSLSTWALV